MGSKPQKAGEGVLLTGKSLHLDTDTGWDASASKSPHGHLNIRRFPCSRVVASGGSVPSAKYKPPAAHDCIPSIASFPVCRK